MDFLLLRTEAAAFQPLLPHALVEPDSLIRWADRWIVALPEPPTELFDISLGNSVVNKLHSCLRSLVESGPPLITKYLAASTIGLLRGKFEEDSTSGPRIARVLFRMAIEELIPGDEFVSTMYSLDDAYDLAAEGVYGTRAEVDDELSALLSRFPSIAA